MKMIKVEDFNLSADYGNGHVSNELVIALRIDDETAAELKKVCSDVKPLLRDADIAEGLMDPVQFDKAQKKQKEEMNDIASNSMQCCMPKHSLCDTCRKVLVCPMMQISMREKCELYEKLPNPLDEYITETRSLNPIKEENKMEAWKERLKEEYSQLKERYEKLRAYNNKKEIESYLMGDCSLKPEEYHSNRLLKKQQSAMGEYLHILELRAELAHIEL